MKSASNNTLPDQPPNDVTSGLDWARDNHAVAVVDARGREIDRETIEHSAAGLRHLLGFLGRHRVREVAIERPDGPVVEALLDAGITVVVISPNQVKNLRGRYGSAGNKDDRFDAYVLADTLRTDRARLVALSPDTDSTITLRRACRARKDLVAHRVGIANQPRAHLRNVFPGAVELFADLDSPISLAFLTRFDFQERADWLSPKRLAAWLASVGYCGRLDPAVLHARLTAAPRGATGDHGTAEAHTTRALPAVLHTLVAQIKTLSDQIGEQLAAHADARIFTSLPRTLTPTSSPACPAPGPSAPPGCLPRSATAAPVSPPPSRWPASPASPPRPASPASFDRSGSAGPATNSSATPSPTSPATRAAPTPEPPTSTAEPAPAATPPASLPAPGSTSSGTAGKTTPSTTPTATEPSNNSSTKINKRLLTATSTSTPPSTASPGSPTPSAWPMSPRKRPSRSGPELGPRFAVHGITRITRVVTDNGSCYRSATFA